MNEFPIAAIRHVPGSATSACEIVLTKANAGLFKNLAARVLVLASGMQQFKARSLVAEDYVSHLVEIMQLKSVTFDCGSGCDPCVTLAAKDGTSYRLTLSKAQFAELAVSPSCAMCAKPAAESAVAAVAA